MIFQFPNGQQVRLDQAFSYQGFNYPADWLRNMSAADRAAWGLVELPEPVAPVTPAPPAVPQVVTPLQARRAINAAGLRTAIEAAVAAADQNTKDAWEYATEIRRDNALIATMAAALNLTETDIDNLFIAAANSQ